MPAGFLERVEHYEHRRRFSVPKREPTSGEWGARCSRQSVHSYGPLFVLNDARRFSAMRIAFFPLQNTRVASGF